MNKTLIIIINIIIIYSCTTNDKSNEDIEKSDLDIFIEQTDKIYKNLVTDATVSDINALEYNTIDKQEFSFEGGVRGSIKQKVVEGDLGVNIIYQKIESGSKKEYRKVVGKTDATLQKKIAEIALIGIKCYDYEKKKMDEVCKREAIESIINNKNKEVIEPGIKNKSVPDTIKLPFKNQKIRQ